MIANIIVTTILALGIATGNVSSNSYKGGNAFNYEEKHPQIKKSPEYVNTTYEYNKVQSLISYNLNLSNDKYVLTLPNANNTSAIQNTGYFNIYNSTYSIITTHGQIDGSVTVEYLLVGINKIKAYWNTTNISLNIIQDYEITNLNNANSNWVLEYDVYETPNDIENLIDMNLTNGTKDEIYNFYHNANITKNNRLVNRVFPGSDITLENNNFTLNYTTLPMNQEEERMLVISMRITQNNFDVGYNSGYLAPKSLTITTNALIPQINYEVVDIPNLMFTILTMPFSFISTAFNVTIFPGTPYALNFGNLVYTIIAAFILLYLIKKIFK